MNRKACSSGESGMSLLELIIAVPLLAALFASAAILLWWILRIYAYSISDWELIAEVRRSAASITEDISYAESVVLDHDNKKMTIHTFGCNAEEAVYVEYHWKQSPYPHLVKDGQPMTGESRLGQIYILEFEEKKLEPDLLQLSILGKNQRTGHEYRMETVVQLYDGKIVERF